MKVTEFFPSPWIAAEDLAGRRWEFVIAGVTMEKVHDKQTNQKVDKLVVAFVGPKKRLILNKTNAMALAHICDSDETDDWKGKRVALRAGIAPNRKATIVIEPAAVQAPAVAIEHEVESQGLEA